MSHAYEQIYGIGLLDDLHNYFPDVLYNPVRFNSVRDLLSYIQTTTQHRFDLYSYGRSLVMPAVAATTAAPAAAGAGSSAAAAAAPATPINRQTNNPFQTPITGVNNERLVGANGPLRIIRQRITPLTMLGTSLNFDEFDNSLTDNLLTSMLSNLIRTPVTQNFNEPVIVRPTEAQIAAATRVESVSAPMEDICSICQDDYLEENTQIRKISACGHFFHKRCIDEWFERNVRCPVCRYDIRTQGGASSSGGSNVATTSH